MVITIVQLDLKTQKMIPVLPEPVSDFQIEGEQLYYSKPTFGEGGTIISHQFYKMPVDGGQSQTIGEVQENTDRFFVRDGQIFSCQNREYIDGKGYLYEIRRISADSSEILSDKASLAQLSGHRAFYLENSFLTGEPSKMKIYDITTGKTKTIKLKQEQNSFFANESELLIWSFQDRTLRYYQIP